eukprot:CAMPEP_0171227688 /NCGR_PEP_ID=MMETSP0790-20130122/37976_1 /TAXON_ID=2925 /ORGANISM="Alexandrium catenella, Strain OF101" /LENGTH=332 /DNA_ID=CAMNT_0011693809 /DNA_START=11 /DNA_END=1006 /DNA_ORIENTATION=+
MAEQGKSASKFTVATGDPVFYRSYSRRKPDGHRESYAEAIGRAVDDLAALGSLDEEEKELVMEQALAQRCLPSGRWLWVGGTEWIKDRLNFSGAYNCTSTEMDDPSAFGLLMDLAMMGCGTGAVIEQRTVEQLPVLHNTLRIGNVVRVGKLLRGREETLIKREAVGDVVEVSVGDSRKGWVDAYQALIDLAYDAGGPPEPREAGGGLPAGRRPAVRGARAQADSRRVQPADDEAASCVVAGNIRRSAGIRQFSADDEEASTAKLSLYTQVDGVWRVDKRREALRMANHTRVFHRRPTPEEIRGGPQPVPLRRGGHPVRARGHREGERRPPEA